MTHTDDECACCAAFLREGEDKFCRDCEADQREEGERSDGR
jgi:hypothetical protein